MIARGSRSRVVLILTALFLGGCYDKSLRADSDDVQYRRLKATEVAASTALRVLVPRPAPVERDEHGDPVGEPDLMVVDTRGMSEEDVQALVVAAANAFSAIEHNTERSLAWAKADAIGSGVVEPERQLELGSDEEHTRNAQHLANESRRAYNLSWWRAAVRTYRGVIRFYRSARFWLKWGGLALAVGFAGFAVIEWLGKRRERAARGEEAAAVGEAVAALDEIKRGADGGRKLVADATAGKECLRRGRARTRAGGGA